MYYMHQMNIAHRDLKIENIYVDKYDNIKIGDFNYSLLYDLSTKNE